MIRAEALNDTSEQGQCDTEVSGGEQETKVFGKKRGIIPREKDWILTGSSETVTLENRRQKPSGQPCVCGPLRVEPTLLHLAAPPASLRPTRKG